MMGKCKLFPEWKELHYAAKTTSALCKYLHRQHANTELAKNSE